MIWALIIVAAVLLSFLVIFASWLLFYIFAYIVIPDLKEGEDK